MSLKLEHRLNKGYLMPESKFEEMPEQQEIEFARGRNSSDLVHDTAAVYTCSYEIAHDYASQCRKNKEEFEIDVVFTNVAHEIWAGRSGKGQQIADTLAKLLAARRKYLATITELLPRFEGLMDPTNHEHLEPIERYRQQVKSGLLLAED